MNTVIFNVYTKDLETLKKTQKRLEEELKKFMLKELKSFSKVAELTDKLIVHIIS
jgi:hypothetical protein